jgi:hypothetical protein
VAEKEKLKPLVDEITEQLAHNNEKLTDALYWIGEETSPHSNGLNLTDALVGMARALYAVADAIKEKREPEAKAPAADVRPVDLKKIRLFTSQFGPGSWTGRAPGQIPLLPRDISTQEIYAFDLQLP